LVYRTCLPALGMEGSYCQLQLLEARGLGVQLLVYRTWLPALGLDRIPVDQLLEAWGLGVHLLVYRTWLPALRLEGSCTASCCSWRHGDWVYNC
jgi:hypothetical protein